MLEEMRSEYDHTQAAFGVIMNAALAEIKCGPELKKKLRDAGKHVFRCDWHVVRATDLDKYFLTWLCSDSQPWLYTDESLDHFLPATVLDGIENLSDRVAKEAAEKRWREASRRARIDRCAAALLAGWPECDAITFVESKEEWAEARGGR